MRIFLTVLAMYLIGDGTIHLLNIRLGSVINVWPASAVSYAILLDSIYASFVFLVAALILVAQTDLKKYKSLIVISGVWAILHGTLLLYLNSTQNFAHDFFNYPSLYVWIPFYNQYLLFEALLSFVYAIVVFIWNKGIKL